MVYYCFPTLYRWHTCACVNFIWGWYPPKDLPFLTYLFGILWFGMISDLFFERGWQNIDKYIYIYKHVYIYTGICTSQKIANFANFPGFKIQDSGGNFLNPGLVSQRLDSRSFSQNLESWIPTKLQICKLSWIQDSRFWGKLLESRPGLGFKKFFSESWILNPQKIANLQAFLDSRFKILGETSWTRAWSASAWIQEVFPRILNLESQQNCKFANFLGFKIQDSGGNFLNPGLVLDSRSFSPNLESWTPKKLQICKLSWIQDSRFWGKLLESRPGLGFKKFFSESWILNPNKTANLQTFLNSRFKILGETSWTRAWSASAWIQEVFPRILNLESQQNCKFANFLGLRFKILGETSWIQAWSWIQEVFLRILNLEPPKNCKFANFLGFKIQDSGGNFLNPGLVLDSRSFSQNLESWTPKKLQICKLSWVQDSRFWVKLLESRPGLGFKKFFSESWILNPNKIANLQTFLDSRFKILAETSWIQALFWIQEVFLRILNLESQKNCKFANFLGFKIQDSGGNFLNPGLVLDSRSFSQNLESWTPKKLQICKLSWIQDSRFWGKLLESRPGLGFKKFFSESWILNPQKIANLQAFLNSRFKILGETSWTRAWSASAWIQEVFLRILNLESPKNCKFANFLGFKIQDSGGNFLNPGLVLDSRSFSQNLESWTPKKLQICKLSWIQDSRFWGKLLESTPGLGFKKFFSESWILNPQKIANLQTFLNSRFKILGETSCPGLVSQRLDSRSFSQNLESWIPTKLQICKLSWIQDSRFWGKLLESRPGLGFKKFFSESWILNPQKIANLQTFLDSRFKILGETSWIHAWSWIQEVFLRILNLEPQKIANLQTFLDSRFLGLDGILKVY